FIAWQHLPHQIIHILLIIKNIYIYQKINQHYPGRRRSLKQIKIYIALLRVIRGVVICGTRKN
ncbi:hypothetical protein ACH54_21440, partial [Salmonella enterica subsp. enterica serovar Infantis]